MDYQCATRVSAETALSRMVSNAIMAIEWDAWAVLLTKDGAVSQMLQDRQFVQLRAFAVTTEEKIMKNVIMAIRLAVLAAPLTLDINAKKELEINQFVLKLLAEIE